MQIDCDCDRGHGYACDRDRDQLISEIVGDMLCLRRRFFGQRGGPRPGGGIPPAQGMALHMVANLGEMGIRRMSGLMGVSSSAVTQFVDSLVGAGLLVRETDPDDRRSVRVSLTSEGRRMAESFERRHYEGAVKLLGPLTDEELRTFWALLRKITGGLVR